MTHTPAYHIIDGKRIIMPAHSITLYPPYSSIEYGSLENEIFCDDWLRFYTDEPFICNGSVPLGTPFKAMDHSYISSLIHLIAVENFFQNQYKNFTVQSLFQILFSKLKESLSYNKSSTFHETALQQLHININQQSVLSMEYTGYGQTITHFNKASAKIVSKKIRYIVYGRRY